ncbi:MAG TPA: VIT1/CCC1 transporter family protein [Candidatus Binataceae bacterium]|nr:VIT1/CCC1 transporter family protein [Candidatus Binataceae bacterium]
MALEAVKREYANHTERVHAIGGTYLRDLMLGLNDGLVAAFAVTSGVAGAFTSERIVVMAGLAEMLGGSISMGLAAFASARAHREYYRSEEQRERDEIRLWPDHERDEIRSIYRDKGFSGALLDQIVSHITSDPARWRNVMMHEELGFGADVMDPPFRSGLAVSIAYLIGAAVPWLPYLFVAQPFGILVSALATTIALFGVGAGKTIITARSWWRSGFESMLIGVVAAAITYSVGLAFGAH